MVKKTIPSRYPPVPNSLAKLYIAEYMAIRGMKPADLAAKVGVTEAAVSRWINEKRKLNQHKQNTLEQLFKLPPGGLRRPPSEAPKESLLAGMTEDQIELVLSYIGFVRSQN